MKKVYTKQGILGKLWLYFSLVFSHESNPTKMHLFDLALSVLGLNGFHSIKFNFDHFIAQKCSYSLKSLYYTLSYSKINIDCWTLALVRLALKLLPTNINQPIILSIDDTMVEKYGSHFAYRSKLFDHAAHNGTNYLHGHCFVSLLLSIPILDNGKERYIHIPVGYRMWTKEKSKLDMAADLVRKVMEIVDKNQLVCLCCDSWYPKGAVLNLVEEFSNLAIICNARIDTALYTIAERTGKRGRPRIYGDKLTIDDFALSKIDNLEYCIGYRTVRTHLFGNKDILAIVTQPLNGNSKRLFLCTMMPEQLHFDLHFLPDTAASYGKADEMLLPLSIYAVRWHIETAFYEQKTYWGLRDYKVRSKQGIERLMNLLTVCYSLMTLLPYLEPVFASLKEQSAQQTRFLLGQAIFKQLFLTSLADKLENRKKYGFVSDCLKHIAFTISLVG